MESNHSMQALSAAVSHRGGVLFDITGLVQWYAYLRHPSGIQRVMENILTAVADRADVTFAARAMGSDTFYEIDRKTVVDLTTERRQAAIARLRSLFAASMRVGKTRRLVREMRAIHLPYLALGMSFTEGGWEAYCGGSRRLLPSTLKRLPPGARFETVVGLGDFWCHAEQVDGLIALKQRSGAHLVHLIHDLAAVANPQWTHPHYGRQFVDQLRRLAPHVDHWLATSRHVAGQVTQYLQQIAAPPRSVSTIPMGWPRIPAGPVEIAADLAVLHRLGLKQQEYLLHVGTVEPRKNLPGLFDAMGLVAGELGERAPRCVLVGRDGWRSGDVRHRLKCDDRLSSQVVWLQGASDSELRTLYRFARFTVVPSFDEGWGLAAQESLAHGTPCVAAAVGGIPESGRGLVCYAASCAPADLARVMLHLLTDREALLATRDAIAMHMSQSDDLPTWQMAADAVLAAARGRWG